MTHVIRRATADDLDAIFALVAQFATSFKPEREAYALSFSTILADDAACLLVAEQHGRVIGYCLGFDHYTFYANGRVTWVEEIMVLPEQRRSGIGRDLMAALEAWAQTRQSAVIALATRRAAAFYLGIGYEDSATYFRKKL